MACEFVVCVMDCPLSVKMVAVLGSGGATPCTTDSASSKSTQAILASDWASGSKSSSPGSVDFMLRMWSAVA